jgi:hypothetical protein
MKKLKVISLSALAFVTIASMVFVGCQKQQELVSTKSESDEIKLAKIKEKYKQSGLNKINYTKAGYMAVADGIGAGAASSLGPWGSLWGGFGASLAAGEGIITILKSIKKDQ